MSNNKLKKNILLRYAPLVIFTTILAAAPLLLPAYYVSLLLSVMLWIGIAVSWHFFSGNTKYISLGSAAFFGTGVYTTAIFQRSMPFLSVLLLAYALTFIFAFAVGAVTLRLKGIYFTIFTFGLAELLNNAILFWEMKVTGTRGRFIMPMDIYYYILVITLIVLTSIMFLRRTRLGLALRAMGENEEAAEHFGVNTTFYKIFGFALSSAFIGVLGAAFAPRWGYIDSGIAFNSLYSFMPVIMTLFGGMETFLGPIIGAIIISLLEEYLLTNFKSYFMLILGLIMITIILVMPEGITERFRKTIRRLGRLL
ncbi:MAG: branched-chain amino acid ABC transporter permease [Candidatus Bathyarchaeia archaeon]